MLYRGEIEFPVETESPEMVTARLVIFGMSIETKVYTSSPAAPGPVHRWDPSVRWFLIRQPG